MIKEEILKALRASEAYVSGQELCERFGVSRTAVWKAVTRLKEEGYAIDSVSNKGYCLKELPDVVTEAEIGSRLKTKVMGRSCVCFDTTDSTNIQAKRLAEEGAPHGTLVCAERQTEGRGRRGRSWSSPPGEAVYMSLLLRPEIRPEHASMLTLVMGLAAARACNELLGRMTEPGIVEPGRAETRAEDAPQPGEMLLSGKTLRIGLKWPNDLVLDGRKAAGILTEMSAEIDCIHYVVIGVGINVNTQIFPESLTQAASLRQAAGRPLMRSELIALCMEYFEEYYGQFEETEDLSSMRKDYEELLVNKGRQVQVLEPGNEHMGTALGINDQGELLVRLSDGRIEQVYAGEVSVRGVYGYV